VRCARAQLSFAPTYLPSVRFNFTSITRLNIMDADRAIELIRLVVHTCPTRCLGEIPRILRIIAANIELQEKSFLRGFYVP